MKLDFSPLVCRYIIRLHMIEIQANLTLTSWVIVHVKSVAKIRVIIIDIK